jgi:hypothetical protein
MSPGVKKPGVRGNSLTRPIAKPKIRRPKRRKPLSDVVVTSPVTNRGYY